MKKFLLSLVALVATLSSFAETKTVTFDFSNPAAYGYEAPAASAGTTLAVGGTIVSGDVTIANSYTGESLTAVRFFNSKGTITFRLAAEGAITVTANGNYIKKITLKGNYVATINVSNLTADGEWTGSAKSVKLARIGDRTVQMSSMEVTYEVKEGGDDPNQTTNTFDDIYVPLKFDGVNYTVNDEWANAVIDNANGKSEVAFSTPNIDFIAVGGTTPKDVELAAGEPFSRWLNGWNDVKWDRKNQNLDDLKTRYFAYIVGTGNPVIETNAEEVTTDGQQTGRWRATYVYYGPVSGEINGKNYKRSLPSQGLYYQFTAKKSGKLKIAVWSNKGKRNTFVIDKETMDPVEFECEGYYNGQNEADPNNAEKNQKKWLTNDDFVLLHNNAFTRTPAKNEDGTTKVDEAGNTIYETIEDTYPYVIGDGNQNFWGYLVMPLKSGQTYLLFQDSSQIGFGGFQFTDGDVAEGDLFSAKASVFLPEGISKVDGVTYNGDNTFTATANTEVTVTFTTACTEYTLTGVKGTITPSAGAAWVVKSAENGTVVVAYEGEAENPKYAVSFTSDADETFSIANTGAIADGIATVKADNTTVAPAKVITKNGIMIGNFNIAGQRVK